eukprot:14936824-Alexandrium_andersonii.AAC.1
MARKPRAWPWASSLHCERHWNRHAFQRWTTRLRPRTTRTPHDSCVSRSPSPGQPSTTPAEHVRNTVSSKPSARLLAVVGNASPEDRGAGQLCAGARG